MICIAPVSEIHEQGDQVFGQLFTHGHTVQLILKAVGFQNFVNMREPSEIHLHGCCLSENSFDNEMSLRAACTTQLARELAGQQPDEVANFLATFLICNCNNRF